MRQPGRRTGLLVAILGVCVSAASSASPLSATQRSALSQGRPVFVIVEFDAAEVNLAAADERVRRRIVRDDAAVVAQRAQGYSATKSRVEAAVSAADAVRVRDYEHFPLSLWRLNSLAALARFQSHPSVRVVHQNILLHAVSVSDLGFINQPAAAQQGSIGAGTAIAVIDGGLGSNFLNYADFGTCTDVNTPAASCRVAYNFVFYPGASAETTHGTNVSAIALGVAPGARLVMFDVFNGTNATASDILSSINSVITMRATYNIVALNMSLGDSTSNATPCSSSVFASAVVNASNAGIITVAAAGNSGSKSGLANPACAPGVVSVGAVYDASYGSQTWISPAVAGGQCTDISAPDKITCFSQSANYLSLLAPGTFVNAPTSAFQQSGTSQATPHVSGSVAVLRARYPAEPLASTVQRLQITGTLDTDTQNALSARRINLLAAVNQGTSVSLSGSGPSTATNGAMASYTMTATNTGPLAATSVRISNTLPSTANFLSASSGCTLANRIVTCVAPRVDVGAAVTFTINVQWTASAPVYDTAVLSVDQINSAAPALQTLAFGVPPALSSDADAPLPSWIHVLLGMGLFAIGVLSPIRARRRTAAALRA